MVEPPKSSRNQISNSKSEKEFSFVNNINNTGATLQTTPDVLPQGNSKAVAFNTRASVTKLTVNNNNSVTNSTSTSKVNFIKSEKAFDYPVQRRTAGTSTTLANIAATSDHK